MLIQELPFRPPLAALQAFAEDPAVALLDAAAAGDPRGRHAYLAVEPYALLRCEGAPGGRLAVAALSPCPRSKRQGTSCRNHLREGMQT